MISEGLKAKGSWTWVAVDSSGHTFAVRNTPNLPLNIGLNTLCSLSFDSGSSQTVFDLTVIGTDNTAPNATQSGVIAPVQTQSNTFTKGGDGVCEMSSSHTGLTATISEAGLMNDTDLNYFNRATLSDDVTLSSGDTLNLVCTVSYS